MLLPAAGLAAQLLLGPGAAAQDAEQLLDRALDRLHKDAYAEARQDLEQASRLSPSDARILALLAVTRASLGDCGSSIDELILQAGRNPDAEIRRLAGISALQCLLPINRLDDILPILTRLRKDYPDDPDVLYFSAQVFNRGWGYARAELDRKAPESYRTFQLAGEIEQAQGHAEKAIEDFRAAIAKNPAALNLHYELGRALLSHSRDAETLKHAREAFEAELKLNPSNAAAEYQVAQIALAEGNKDDAAAHFERAIQIAPRFTQALLDFGKLRLDTGDNDEAVALLERAVTLQPSMEEAHHNLMLAYERAGRSRDAQRERKQIEKLKEAGSSPAVTP